MYVRVCVCVYVCVCMCVCLCLCACVCVRGGVVSAYLLFVGARVHVSVHVCECLRERERESESVYVRVLKAHLPGSLRGMHGGLRHRRMRTTQSRGSCVHVSAAVG